MISSDSHLSPDKIRYLTLTDAGKVWMPDTFFRNEKVARFHKILAPNLYIRVFPDGDVLYSIRCVLELPTRARRRPLLIFESA